jgi:hypothetical protein
LCSLFSPISEYSVSMVLTYAQICSEMPPRNSLNYPVCQCVCTRNTQASIKCIFLSQEWHADWLVHSKWQNVPRMHVTVHCSPRCDGMQFCEEWGMYL